MEKGINLMSLFEKKMNNKDIEKIKGGSDVAACGTQCEAVTCSCDCSSILIASSFASSTSSTSEKAIHKSVQESVGGIPIKTT